MKKILLTALVAATLAASAQTETKGRPGLVVYKAKATPALALDMKNRNMDMTLARIGQALDSHLEAAIAGSRKFTVLDRNEAVATDVDIEEVRGADYLVFISLDSYLDSQEKLQQEGKTYVKRRFQLSGQVKITGGKTTEILDMSNIQINPQPDVIEVKPGQNTDRMDEMLPLLTRAFAEQSFERLMGVAFPMKVLDAEDGVITINRGEDFLSVGDLVEIFGKGRVIVDEDTGEEIKVKGKSLGKAKITSTEPNYSQAKAVGDVDVPAGAEVRKAQ